jgi:protein subunit release factor B
MSAFPPEFIRSHLATLRCDIARVEESFTHSGGAGGQNVNKVATCVQLRYAPANILIKMQEHRTQAQNRLEAWKLLAAQLQRARDRAVAERRAARELKRRQNAQRPRGIKRQFVEHKRRRAKIRTDRNSQGDD